MTYWATLWYAGQVVMTISFDGMSLEHCNELKQVIMEDIQNGFVENIEELEAEGFSDPSLWKATCETKELPTVKDFQVVG